MAGEFDRCITVSKADTGYLRSISPKARIETIPSGVDTEYFFPDETVPVEPYSIVFTGGFHWKPKRHNLKVLLNDFFPKIKARLPQATLNVVGKGVPDELRSLAETISGVTISGSVPDVRPYIHRAALSLNFVESGGGIALKILEAMAMRKPVLSNAIGCEGIDAKHGENVFLADGPEAFAEAAVFLLRHRAVRDRIAEGGYQLVKQNYAWERLAVRFEDTYREVLSERASPAARLLRDRFLHSYSMDS